MKFDVRTGKHVAQHLCGLLKPNGDPQMLHLEVMPHDQQKRAGNSWRIVRSLNLEGQHAAQHDWVWQDWPVAGVEGPVLVRWRFEGTEIHL